MKKKFKMDAWTKASFSIFLPTLPQFSWFLPSTLSLPIPVPPLTLPPSLSGALSSRVSPTVFPSRPINFRASPRPAGFSKQATRMLRICHVNRIPKSIQDVLCSPSVGYNVNLQRADFFFFRSRKVSFSVSQIFVFFEIYTFWKRTRTT